MPSEEPARVIWTPSRTKVRDWLASKRPILGESYDGLVNLLEMPRLPGRAKLVAHTVREILNILIYTLVGPEADGSKSDLVSIVEKRWAPISGIAPGAVPSSSTVSISWDTASAINDLVEAHRRPPETQIDRIALLFSALQIAPGADPDTFRPQAMALKENHAWFVAKSHERTLLDADLLNDEFNRRCAEFERALEGLATTPAFFEAKEDIDAILDQANG